RDARRDCSSAKPIAGGFDAIGHVARASKSGRLYLLSSYPSVRMSAQYERMLPGTRQHVPKCRCGSGRCGEQRLPCLEQVSHEAGEDGEVQSSEHNIESVGKVKHVFAGVPGAGNVVCI